MAAFLVQVALPSMGFEPSSDPEERFRVGERPARLDRWVEAEGVLEDVVITRKLIAIRPSPIKEVSTSNLVEGGTAGKPYPTPPQSFQKSAKLKKFGKNKKAKNEYRIVPGLVPKWAEDLRGRLEESKGIPCCPPGAPQRWVGMPAAHMYPWRKMKHLAASLLGLPQFCGLFCGGKAEVEPTGWGLVRKTDSETRIHPAGAAAQDKHAAVSGVENSGLGGDLFVSRSKDGGRTFGEAVRVNPSRGTACLYRNVSATVHIDTRGMVRIAWIDAGALPDTTGGRK